MPRAAKRPCRKQLCPNLVERGRSYCPLHTRDRYRDQDQRRGSAHQRGYTRRWRRASQAYLLDHPYCNHCNGPANVVDHIDPHRGDYDKFWNVDNWQPLCKRCHDRKTGEGL